MEPTGPDLKAIFADALDHPTGPERAAFLDRACNGDADLRLRVESLLWAYHEAGDFLAAPAGPEATADHREPGSTASLPRTEILEGPGTSIGPYKLLQQIGEGGMGVVFMAEQERPVRRKVALKVIKPGMDTAQVIARFEAERQALAMMDHPNIARVLDVGATGTGRPFFVMELVKGVPITEYCDRNHLSPRERLELFIPVCRAIQHAHQKGIIHRDIKPSNVLVTLHDGLAIPKVIDFGVAKAIDQRLTEKTMFTEFGAVIGTLEYMSPEQAEMGALDVDTRSDIYSLGVLLYELLTGSTPLERAKLRKAAYSEILRRIREEEPTKPSTRLSESKDTLPSISAQRKMEPARLTKLIRGDLDWIVMKALEKDRTRRYETATGFARDIQRYLDGDPVEACPPSAAYKLRKFARKHRTALATAGAFALGLIVATAVSVGLALWANHERVRAVKAEESTRVEKERAQEREKMAIDAVKRYGDVIIQTPELKNNLALAPLRSKLLKEPARFFEKLRDRLQSDKETEPKSLAMLAHAQSDLGRLANEIGDKQDALRAYRESLEIHERLAPVDPSQIESRDHQAAILHDIGNLLQELGRPTEALASFERSRALSEDLAREVPGNIDHRANVASCHSSIASLMIRIGRGEEALASQRAALDIRRRLASENPADDSRRRELAESYFNLGATELSMNRHAEAERSLREAVAVLEQIARERPADTRVRRSLGGSLNNLGNAQLGMGQRAESMDSYRRALAIQQELVRENPSSTLFRADLATSFNNLGRMESGRGRAGEAMALHQRALEVRRALVVENPAVVQFRRDLAETINDLGNPDLQAGRLAEARALNEQALAIRERLLVDDPSTPDSASDVGASLNNLANIDLKEGEFEAARNRIERAIELQRRALAANPNHPTFRRFLANHLLNLARVDDALGDAEGAERARRELAGLTGSRAGATGQTPALAKVASPLDPAYQAYQQTHHASSAALFEQALAKDPKLAEDRQAQHRYNAACAAALAGCGQAKDDPPPDDAARAKLRKQALDWLRDELAAWTKVLDSGPANQKAAVVPILRHWKADADLAGIRDDSGLEKLPEAERAGFRQLWADVDALLSRASNGR